MKKLIALVAILSFTAGLNANSLRENIYNSNPAQFDQLKQELQNLNAVQAEKQRKAFIEEQAAKAFKAVFSNKEILRNSNFAIVKDGQIIKTGNNDEEGGILFWHEHSENVPNPPGVNNCIIEDVSWQSLNYDTPCGNVKFQMLPTSPFMNNLNNLGHPRVYLVKDIDESVLEDSFPNGHGTWNDLAWFLYYETLVISDTEQAILTAFKNNQVITDTVVSAGYFTPINSEATRMVKPTSPNYLIESVRLDFVKNYYTMSDQVHDGHAIYTLKDGSYYQVLRVEHGYSNDWNSFYVMLKWFKINVVNNYLRNLTGIADNNAEGRVSIKFNNKEISIELADSVNPEGKIYELYNISGQLVQRLGLSSHNTKIAMPNVASGTYFIRVYGKDLSVNKKIVYTK